MFMRRSLQRNCTNACAFVKHEKNAEQTNLSHEINKKKQSIRRS